MATGFHRPWRALGLLLAIVAAAVAIGASSPSLRERAEIGYHQTLQCYDTDNTINTSVCVRFQLWRAAWHAFSHNPVIGLGDHSLFKPWMKTRALPDGVVSKYVANNYGEPHNDMMQALSSFGVLGGLGLLTVYFAPTWLFVRRMGRGYSRQTRVAAAMGAALCLGFAIFCVTELMFRGMRTVGFYTMFVALFLVLSEPDDESAA
jgi:O-antigen ligase